MLAGRFRDDRRAVIGLAVVVALVLAAYVVFGLVANVPRFLLDELYYLQAGTSLAQGHGLRWRDQPWGYGPVFPTLIAGIVHVTGNQETTAALVRGVNAVAYALALIPVYLLAKRVLRTWSAVGIAALVAVFPSTTYTSLVMTECLTFLVCSWLILAMVWTLERRSLLGQLAVWLLTLLSYGIRTQFIVVFVAWPLAVGCFVMLRQRGIPRLSTLRPWWPTGALCVGALVLILGRHLAGGGGGHGLGAYDALVVDYSPADVVLTAMRQLGDLALFLAFAPLVVAPIGLALLRSRRDARGDAFVAVFVVLNVTMILTVAVFASSEYAVGTLHDRNLFYLYPLWLVVFAYWLEGGLPRPRRLAAVGALATLVVVAVLPFDEIAAEGWLQQHEAPSTEIWGHVGRVVPVGVAAIVVCAICVALTLLVPSRWRALPVVVLVVFLGGNLLSAWRSARLDETAAGAGPTGTRNWVDRAIGDRARATLLLRESECSPDLVAATGLMTLFFNRSALDSVVVGDEGVAKPEPARIAPGGLVVTKRDGKPVAAAYVVTGPRAVLRGSRIATGGPAHLVLWKTDGRVRVASMPVAGCAG